MRQTWELMRACLPTREDKQRVRRLLGLKNDSSLYKQCEDPGRSGRPNIIDKIDILLDHARLFYPEAAAALIQHFDAGNIAALTRNVGTIPIAQLLAALQPNAEKEAIESVTAFSAGLRQLLTTGKVDLHKLLTEVEENERQAKAVAVILCAAIAAEESKTGAAGAGPIVGAQQ